MNWLTLYSVQLLIINTFAKNVNIYKILSVNKFNKNQKLYTTRLMDIFWWDEKIEFFQAFSRTYTVQHLMEKDIKHQTFYVDFFQENQYPIFTFDFKKQEFGGIFGEIWMLLQNRFQIRSLPPPAEHLRDVVLSAHQVSHNSIYPIVRLPYFLYVKYPQKYDDYIYFSNIFSIVFLSVTTATICVIGLLLWLHLKYSFVSEEASFSLCLLSIFGAICSQGVTLTTSSFSSKLVLMVGQIYALFILTALTADITAHTNLPIENLNDLLHQSEISICAINPETIEYLMTQGFEMDVDLNSPQCGQLNGLKDVLTAICKRNIMMFDNILNFYPILKINNELKSCNFVQLPKRYNEVSITFALYHRSNNYKYLINLYLLKLDQFGILKYMTKKYTEALIPVPEDFFQLDEVNPVTTGHVLELFLYLACGFFMGFAVLILECIHFGIKNRNLIVDK